MPGAEVGTMGSTAGATQVPAPEQWVAGRHGAITRYPFALLLGPLAGLLVPNSIQAGVALSFSEPVWEWHRLIWGNHWMVGLLASLAGAMAAGFLGGIVARRRGKVVGALAGTPAAAVWLYFCVSAWSGRLLWYPDAVIRHVSIGWKLSSTVAAVSILPCAAWAGAVGAALASDLRGHFDNRTFTLLGLKWYHYSWLPLYVHFAIVQTTWAGLYALTWVLLVWQQTSFGFLSLVPFGIAYAVVYSVGLSLTGIGLAYSALAGLRPFPSVGKAVLKYGFGYPILAAAIQAAVLAAHVGFIRWAGR